MSIFIRIITVAILCAYSVAIQGQSLNRLSSNLPQINKEFQLNVLVVIDAAGLTNITRVEMDSIVELTSKYFSPIGISFSICKWSTIDDYNFDSTVEQTEFVEQRILFNSKNTIDVYLHRLLNQNVDTGGFSDLRGIASTNTYVAISKASPEDLAHEMGHLFGLSDTYQGFGNELVDGSNCATAGDRICDTPADPFNPDLVLVNWQNGCEFAYSGLDANGEYYQPDMGNIMSAYDCTCGFTHGQYSKMAEFYLNNPKRIW